MKFRHDINPYGWIEIDQAEVIPGQINVSDSYWNPRYVTCNNIKGVVVASHWHGALYGGVPVGEATERYPVGTEYEIHNVSDLEIKQRYKLTAHCG